MESVSTSQGCCEDTAERVWKVLSMLPSPWEALVRGQLASVFHWLRAEGPWARMEGSAGWGDARWGWDRCVLGGQVCGPVDPRAGTSRLSSFMCSPCACRSFGGDVSWDKSLCIGATYDVTDPCITHQIVDRPGQQTPVIGR